MTAHWFRQFTSHFNFPNNYTTLDLETSGLSPAADLICTAGAVIVRDGRPTMQKRWILNWADARNVRGEQFVDRAWLRNRLKIVEDALTRKGEAFHHSFDYLSAYGSDPLTCLTEILDLVEEAENNREILVMHNGWWFDVAFLESHFLKFLDIPFIFDDNGVYDTGICEKAAQLHETYSPSPRADESLRAFAYRMSSAVAAGVFWSLGGYCEDKYQLTKQANVPRSALHGAETDALLLHYLMQEHRRMALELTNGQTATRT